MSTDERVVMASRGLQVSAAAAGQMRRHLLDTHQRWLAAARPLLWSRAGMFVVTL